MSNQKIRKIIVESVQIKVLALFVVGILSSGKLVHADLITHSWSGGFDDFGIFVDTGIEGGSFNGTFTYDSLAIDTSSDPLAGIYAMLDWSIDVFFENGDLADQLSPLNGGVGTILIAPDPLALGQLHNLNIEIVTPVSGATMVFGGLYTLPSIISTDLPLDMSDAMFIDGLLGFVAGGSVAATFMTDSTISQIPEPSTLMLLGLGLVMLKLKRQRH